MCVCVRGGGGERRSLDKPSAASVGALSLDQVHASCLQRVSTLRELIHLACASRAISISSVCSDCSFLPQSRLSGPSERADGRQVKAQTSSQEAWRPNALMSQSTGVFHRHADISRDFQPLVLFIAGPLLHPLSCSDI